MFTLSCLLRKFAPNICLQHIFLVLDLIHIFSLGLFMWFFGVAISYCFGISVYEWNTFYIQDKVYVCSIFKSLVYFWPRLDYISSVLGFVYMNAPLIQSGFI